MFATCPLRRIRAVTVPAVTRLFATWFGTGLILRRIRGSDLGSGTLASVLTFPVAIWLGTYGTVPQLLATAVVLALALWSISALVGAEGDAGWIVIDEAAGTFIATISLGWGPGLVALIVFRAADIFKTAFPGVAYAERIPGAMGVSADDVVAGVYGLVAGLLAEAFWFPGLT
jgi:phosphatidylglycerophosphatase A